MKGLEKGVRSTSPRTVQDLTEEQLHEAIAYLDARIAACSDAKLRRGGAA